LNSTPQLRRLKKLILLAIEVIIIIGLIYGVYTFSKVNNVTKTELDTTKVKVNEDIEETTEVSFTGYTTIALFGLDNRELGNYEAGNSDVIMIICINNDTKKMNLVSIYRDTYLNVSEDGMDFEKANSAYARGGCERAISMLNKNLDLNIDPENYITFDFASVADAINILGGVTINIQTEEELEYLNFYIDHTNGILGTDSGHISGTGKQLLDGTQAVAYSRIRYTAGNDYRRAQRQRVVLSKMIKKAKKASLSQMSEILDEIFPQIQTGMDQDELLSMANVMLKYKLKNMRGFPFYKTTKVIGSKGDCVLPCDLVTNVTKLHKILYQNEEYEPSETVETYNQQIINETGVTADSAVIDEYSESDDLDELNGNTTDTETETETETTAE